MSAMNSMLTIHFHWKTLGTCTSLSQAAHVCVRGFNKKWNE